MPDATYDLASDGYPLVGFGDIKFYVRPRFGKTEPDTVEAGGDTEIFYSLIADAGLRLPDETVSLTMKHSPDAENRRELMIIYIADLTEAGTSVEQLMDEGLEGPAWTQASTWVRAEAKKTIRVTAD